jgi:lipooligosaccharide transport system permease protein
MATPLALRVAAHQAQVYRRFWRSAVFAYVLNPVLFLAAIGIGLGSMIDEQRSTVGGFPYIVFVAPGLMAAAAMQGAAADSLWPIMAGTKWVRVFHAMVATPIRPRDVYDGTVGSTTARAAAGATVFLVVAVLFGAVESPWGVVAIPAAALCAAAFAAPLTAFAATQETDLRFPVIMRLGILPLFLVSGTFFPLSQLPGWLQPLAWFSPLWHGVVLCRDSTTGTLGPGSVLVHTAVLAACIAAGRLWGVRTFTARLGQ